MRISSKGRYSLQVMLYLALLQDGETASAHAIALATGISERYLEQLFIPLRKAGMISGVRGAKGGYCLRMEMEKLSAGLILSVSEGKFIPSASHTWNDLYLQIENCLDSITLGDIVDKFHSLSFVQNNIAGNYSAGDYAI